MYIIILVPRLSILSIILTCVQHHSMYVCVGERGCENQAVCTRLLSHSFPPSLLLLSLTLSLLPYSFSRSLFPSFLTLLSLTLSLLPYPSLAHSFPPSLFLLSLTLSLLPYSFSLTLSLLPYPSLAHSFPPSLPLLSLSPSRHDANPPWPAVLRHQHSSPANSHVHVQPTLPGQLPPISRHSPNVRYTLNIHTMTGIINTRLYVKSLFTLI